MRMLMVAVHSIKDVCDGRRWFLEGGTAPESEKEEEARTQLTTTNIHWNI